MKIIALLTCTTVDLHVYRPHDIVGGMFVLAMMGADIMVFLLLIGTMAVMSTETTIFEELDKQREEE